jgi:hypothetical protein
MIAERAIVKEAKVYHGLYRPKKKKLMSSKTKYTVDAALLDCSDCVVCCE